MMKVTLNKGIRINRIKNQAKYYDQHSIPLKDLHIGEKVNMLNSKTWKPAIVIKR